MPAITISAVDTGTEVLTATAHGLLTGDRFRVRNVGGALPTGLSGVTDYFAVRLTADTLKVATSSANALAGTPVVNITGAGSGTNTIEYGLPFCIPTAISAQGVQVKSVDLNGTWNALVALYCLLTAQAQSVWSAVATASGINVAIGGNLSVAGSLSFPGTDTYSAAFAIAAGAASVLTGGTSGVTTALNLSTATTGAGVLPLKVRVGTSITAWQMRFNKTTNGSNTVSAKLWRANNGAPVQIGSTQSNNANAPGVVTVGQSGLSQAVATGDSYFIEVLGSGTTGDQVYDYNATTS